MRYRRSLYEGSENSLVGNKKVGSGMKSNSLENNNTLAVSNKNQQSGGLPSSVASGTRVELEDEDDMFGGTRNYGSSFCSGPRPNRPTMISAKYRQKEERRKVLKISINKLKKIEDPESSLRRSVLINNTMKRLQREAREEKMQKQQSVGGFRCFDFLKDDLGTEVLPGSRSPELADITNLPELKKKEEEESGEGEPASRSRKRSIEEVDESDVHAVLSQFYMPLTPRMITSIDEDEDEIVNVVDLETEGKRPRLDEPSAAERLRSETPRLQDPSKFSCGHSSMFELQSVVYHSLIASLET